MFIPFENKQIFVECHGEGPPIIMLNGIMMSTPSWRPFIPALSKHNKLILLDLLDQGQSTKMSENFDITLQADVVKHVLDALQIPKASVAGISYGASVAMHFAIKYPNYVDKLALFNCIAHTSPWIAAIGESWKLARATPEAYYYATIPIIYSMDFYNKNLDWIEARKAFLIQNVFNNQDFLNAMDRLINSAANHDVREGLNRITAKTLLVGATEDYLTPIAEQKFIREQIPSAELAIMHGCGHAAMYEQPDVFTALLTGFINNKSITL